MKIIKVFVNNEYYATVNNREELGDLIRDNNLCECRITIKEERVEVK